MLFGHGGVPTFGDLQAHPGALDVRLIDGGGRLLWREPLAAAFGSGGGAVVHHDVLPDRGRRCPDRPERRDARLRTRQVTCQPHDGRRASPERGGDPAVGWISGATT